MHPREVKTIIANRGFVIDFLLKQRNILSSGCWEFTGYKCRGYGMVSRKFGGVQINCRINRIIGILYLGLSGDKKIYVLHKCDNPSCFNPEHLYLGNQEMNMQDMCLRNKHRGKLDGESVVAIREKIASGISDKDIAETYGSSRSLITMIRLNRIWRFV